MTYLRSEMLVFFLIYGFLGWVTEVVISAVVHHKFSNRGFFNMPICPKYGIMADILVVVLPTVGEELSFHNAAQQYIITLVVVSVVDFITDESSRRLLHRRFSQYERENLFGGERRGAAVGLVKSAAILLVIKLIHPFVFIAVKVTPLLVLRIVGFTGLAILAVDMFTVLYAGRKLRIRNRRIEEAFQKALAGLREQTVKEGDISELSDREEAADSDHLPNQEDLHTVKKSKEQVRADREELRNRIAQGMYEENLGNKLCNAIWKRLERAYPGITEEQTDRARHNESEVHTGSDSQAELTYSVSEESVGTEDKYVFAQGLCLNKLIWIFVIWALCGDLFETVFVAAKTGIWMSRSSLLYGPFSIVWGFGAVIITIVTQRLANREDRYVFLSGCVLWGVYEYTCSVISEVVFGRTFWDYSDMMFNIGGRTNLMYCLFGGILSVLWVKIIYPVVSRWIEKIPAAIGLVLTWVLVVLMAADLLLSGAALARYVERAEGEEPSNVFEGFIDDNYPDSYVESVWPNMRVPGGKTVQQENEITE